MSLFSTLNKTLIISYNSYHAIEMNSSFIEDQTQYTPSANLLRNLKSITCGPFFAKWKSKNAKSKNLLMALQCTHWQHDQCSIHLEERKNCNVKKEWFRDWKYVFNSTFFSEYPLKLWQTLLLEKSNYWFQTQNVAQHVQLAFFMM